MLDKIIYKVLDLYVDEYQDLPDLKMCASLINDEIKEYIDSEVKRKVKEIEERNVTGEDISDYLLGYEKCIEDFLS